MKKLTAFLAIVAGIVPAAQAQQPIVTDVHWPFISSYCTFMRAGQQFNYNDPESWRFVFFDNFDTITGSNENYAYVGLHHQVRQLEELSREETDSGEKRLYRTYGEPSYIVEVVMNNDGDTSPESAAFSGTITVSGSSGDEQVEFHGDCGV
jgi:hypothetical protein